MLFAPAQVDDFGEGGFSYSEHLLLYELCALKSFAWVSVTRAPDFCVGCSTGMGMIIWRICRYVGGAYLVARPIRWEHGGHGLTSRPRETTEEPFLDELLRLFGYPSSVPT